MGQATQLGHTWPVATMHTTARTVKEGEQRKRILVETENLQEPVALAEFSG